MGTERPFAASTEVRVYNKEDEKRRAVRFPRHVHGATASFPRLVAVRAAAGDAGRPLVAAGGEWGDLSHSRDGTGVFVSPKLFNELRATGAREDGEALVVYVRQARPCEVVRHARHLRAPVLLAGLVAAGATATLLEQALSSTAPLAVALAAVVLGSLAAFASGALTVALAARA